jgi:hypothetical protein
MTGHWVSLPLLLVLLAPLAAAISVVVLSKEGYEDGADYEVAFDTPKRAAAQLADNTPGFLRRLGPLNLAARLASSGDPEARSGSPPNSVAAYLRQYEDSLLELRGDARERVLRACALARLLLQQLRPVGDGQAAGRLAEMASAAVRRLRIVGMRPRSEVDGTGAENGYAHTAGDTIVLPAHVGDMDERKLAALIVHEAMHVFQRFRADAADAYARRAYGFEVSKAERVAEAGEERANPDTAGAPAYELPGEGPVRQVFVAKESRVTLADVELLPRERGDALRRRFPWARNPEHPYEIMAEEAALLLN